MAGNIKGITIEIDGNTSGLQESLKGVNKSINSTSKELREVDKLLKLDPGNTELIAQKQELLSKAVNETSDKLGTLKEAKKQADDQFAKGEISEEQYRALSREIITTENKLNSFNNELKETDKASKKIDMQKVGSNMAEFGKKAGQVAAQVAKVAAALTLALAVAVGAVAKKMFDAAVNAGTFADDLITLSNQTNVSTDTLQKWGYAARFIDTEVETMTGAMAKMTKTLGTNEGAFTSLGIATRDAGGNLRSQEDIFMTSIDYLGTIENATQRDAIAMELFGKKAQELNPLIKAGGEELKRLGDEALASGLVISGPVLEQFGKFDDTMQQLSAQSSALGKNLIAGFMPAIQGLVEPLRDAMGQINLILSDGLQPGDTDQITTIVSDLVTGLGGQLVEMLPKLIEFIVPAISSLIGILVGILPTLLPVLLQGVMDLIMGLVNAITSNIAPLSAMVTTLINMIVDFLVNNLVIIIQAGIQLLMALVTGIVDAIPTLIPALVVIILDLVNMLLDNIGMLIDAGIVLLLALTDGIITAMPIIMEQMPVIIQKIVAALLNALPMLLVAAIQIIIALTMGIIKNIPMLVSFMPQIIIAIVNAIRGGMDKMQSIGKDLIKGLWEGISNSLTWIKDKITGWVGNVMDFIKKLFKIASPSKLMRDEIGVNMGLGVAEGILSTTGAVGDAMNRLKDKVMVSINPNINPNASSTVLTREIKPTFVINASGLDEAGARILMTRINRQLGELL